MSEPVIEIVKLENGDIVLRHSDTPNAHMVTISFSEQLGNTLQGAEMHIAQSMIQAGMDTFQRIQLDQLKAHETAQKGMLH